MNEKETIDDRDEPMWTSKIKHDEVTKYWLRKRSQSDGVLVYRVFFSTGFFFFWLPLFLSRTFSWHQLRRHGYRIFYYYFFFTRFQSGSKKEGRSFLFFIFRYLLLLFFKNKYLDAPRIKVALVGKSRE